MTLSLHKGGGSHVKSDYAHTLIKHISNTLGSYAFIFRSFTDYPNRIMQLNPTPHQMITTRAEEGSTKEHRTKKKWSEKLNQLHMHQGTSLSPI